MLLLYDVQICESFPFNLGYICTVEFNGYSQFLHVAFELLFESKSQIENSVGIAEFDSHNSKLGLVVLLAKLASLFVW